MLKYRDFALQHLGKCCLEMGNVSDATTLLKQPLTLRQQEGNERLIASTELVLRYAGARPGDRSGECPPISRS